PTSNKHRGLRFLDIIGNSIIDSVSKHPYHNIIDHTNDTDQLPELANGKLRIELELEHITSTVHTF
ncbi:hypothetical protein V5O48_015670, partial [Marasmius crinis-equi]